MWIVVQAVFLNVESRSPVKKVDQRDLLDFKFFCAPCVGALK
jgi:hypothetical protein